MGICSNRCIQCRSSVKLIAWYSSENCYGVLDFIIINLKQQCLAAVIRVHKISLSSVQRICPRHSIHSYTNEAYSYPLQCNATGKSGSCLRANINVYEF